MKLKNQKRFFVHAPAFYGRRDVETGKFTSKRLNLIQNPFDDETKPWRRNIYYFWWEFLRRHSGYQKCCDLGGSGQFRELYDDWGNVHAMKTSGHGGVRKSRQQKRVVNIFLQSHMNTGR